MLHFKNRLLKQNNFAMSYSDVITNFVGGAIIVNMPFAVLILGGIVLTGILILFATNASLNWKSHFSNYLKKIKNPKCGIIDKFFNKELVHLLFSSGIIAGLSLIWGGYQYLVFNNVLTNLFEFPFNLDFKFIKVIVHPDFISKTLWNNLPFLLNLKFKYLEQKQIEFQTQVLESINSHPPLGQKPSFFKQILKWILENNSSNRLARLAKRGYQLGFVLLLISFGLKWGIHFETPSKEENEVVKKFYKESLHYLLLESQIRENSAKIKLLEEGFINVNNSIDILRTWTKANSETIKEIKEFIDSQRS